MHVDKEDTELAVWCACLRAIHGKLKLSELKEVAYEIGLKISKTDRAKFKISDDNAATKLAYKFMCWQSTGKARLAVAAAVWDFIFDRRTEILAIYRKEDATLARYMEESLRRHYPTVPDLFPPGIADDDIFERWKKSVYSDNGNEVLSPGIYQIYRRHKPFVHEVTKRSDEVSALDHVVVTELAYIDSVSKNCMLVASDREVFRGSLHINARMAAYLLFQHQDDVHISFDHRFYCLKLEGREPIYPALTIRTGDTTERPVASECLVVHVSRRAHPELYEAYDLLRSSDPKITRIDSSSIILNYLMPSPAEKLRLKEDVTSRPVIRVRDIPFLAQLVQTTHEGMLLFQEPIRTMESVAVSALLNSEPFRNLKLSVFRYDRAVDDLLNDASGI